MTIAEFWSEYLKKTGQKPEEAVYNGELCFEDSGWAGQSQLNLVLGGKKTAIFTPFPSFEINLEKIPVAGEVYVVEDTAEEPCAVIRLKDVKVIPFNQISWELAAQDGENENLKDWQDKQRAFFEEEADLCGFVFEEEMPVVCEIFELVYKSPL